ncbi:lysophospholipid acyltransferase family protein [Pedobacter quisquiliarum]|nr:lysophospholipid acyltransferase family protein [Pedobacter quisquiliarum]
MIKLLRHAHRIYFLLIILVFSILFYPLYWLAARKPRWYGILNKLRVYHSKICSILAGVRFRFTFEVPLDPIQHYIYCANHTSNLDIMILCILAQGRFHFMGKAELENNPVLGIFFRTIDIAVNRESKISAFRAFKKAGDNLANGMSLLIFPEGGIQDEHYPPQLVPFKNGTFRLAIEKQVPVLPISIVNAWALSWDDGSKYGTRPGICDIYIHKPIFTEHLEIKQDDQLKLEVFNTINSKLVRT